MAGFHAGFTLRPKAGRQAYHIAMMPQFIYFRQISPGFTLPTPVTNFEY